MSGRASSSGRAAARSMDECIDAARLCELVLDALQAYAPHDAAIRSLEASVEASRLAALAAAEAAIRRPEGRATARARG
jgi:hypothetical protein